MKRSIQRVIILVLGIMSFTSCIDRNPVITIITESGKIDIEIYSDRAPVTASNFLRYVDSSKFVNSTFYRVVRADNQSADQVKIEVIQGGRDDAPGGFDPIPHETTAMTGIKHLDGVISMARDKPGSATSEFFICVGDQPSLDFGGKRNRDGQGFAAFGKVISGMDVVRSIHSHEAKSQYLEKRIIIKNIIRRK